MATPPDPSHPEPLRKSDLVANPLDQLRSWHGEACQAGFLEPGAMALATATAQGRASVRMVLLKEIDDTGLVFFTNTGSRKALELAQNPWASAVFFWDRLHRQVRIEGPVGQVPRTQTEAYFATRPRASQIGAWVSQQSQVIDSRSVLEQLTERVSQQFAAGPVPAPEHWSGYRLAVEQVEFWQGQPGRLHDRLLYRQQKGSWEIVRLAP